MLASLTLTPLTATMLFLGMIFFGRAFRQNWKAQGPNWRLKAWIYAVPALVCFAIVAFVPFRT